MIAPQHTTAASSAGTRRCSSRRARRRGVAIAICGVLAVVSPQIRADVVAARGRRPLVSTQVVRLEGGRLYCRGEDGGVIAFPIEHVDYLQITAWRIFNLAEKQRRIEDWRKAAGSYEKALADLQLEQMSRPARSDTEPPALDRSLLVRCRLIAACEALRRFDRAVELYLEVIERMPEVIDGLRPVGFPTAGSAVLESSARRVQAVIDRHGQDKLGDSLARWMSTWPVRPTGSAPAGGLDAPAQTQMRARIAEVAKLVESRRCEAALSRIASLLHEAGGDNLAELLYWRGRAWEENTSAAGASRPADDPAAARAGLSYMRVVVHFPGHKLAAECLYRAADLCRWSGLTDQAAGLWSELVAVYPQARRPDGSLWADKAREELKR